MQDVKDRVHFPRSRYVPSLVTWCGSRSYQVGEEKEGCRVATDVPGEGVGTLS